MAEDTCCIRGAYSPMVGVSTGGERGAQEGCAPRQAELPVGKYFT